MTRRRGSTYRVLLFSLTAERMNDKTWVLAPLGCYDDCSGRCALSWTMMNDKTYLPGFCAFVTFQEPTLLRAVCSSLTNDK
jgi:hypothetical protein